MNSAAENAPSPEALFDQALRGYHEARFGTGRGLKESATLARLESRNDVVGFVQQSLQFLQSQLVALPSHKERACGAGCAFCCHQRIDVTGLEALAIAGALELTHDDFELSNWRDKVQAHAERVRDLTKIEYARARIRCSFLNEENSCSIYPVRPNPCAGWHSMSRERCEENYHSDDPSRQGVPADLGALLQAGGFWSGLSDALIWFGLDAGRYELHSAVHCALTTPHAADRWLRGEPLFQDCTPGLPEAEAVLQFESAPGQVVGLHWRLSATGQGEFHLITQGGAATRSAQ